MCFKSSLLHAAIFCRLNFSSMLSWNIWKTQKYWDFNLIYNIKQRRRATFWKVHLINFLFFINYRKSKTIIKSSLNSHVYWNTLLNILFLDLSQKLILSWIGSKTGSTLSIKSIYFIFWKKFNFLNFKFLWIWGETIFLISFARWCIIQSAILYERTSL